MMQEIVWRFSGDFLEICFRRMLEIEWRFDLKEFAIGLKHEFLAKIGLLDTRLELCWTC